MVVGPSLNVVADVIAYVLDVPLHSSTVIEVDDTAVTVPPAKFAGLGGVVDVDVVLVRGGGWGPGGGDPPPPPPATSPTPSAVVAATFFTVIPLLLMMFLPLRSFE